MQLDNTRQYEVMQNISNTKWIYYEHYQHQKSLGFECLNLYLNVVRQLDLLISELGLKTDKDNYDRQYNTEIRMPN